MNCRKETISWNDNVDEEGLVCHCNNEELCNKDTPNITESSTSSVFPSSVTSSARSVKIQKGFTIQQSKTTRKEVTDPILGKSELIVGVIIYLFLLRCLYSAAPPYGKFFETLFLTAAGWFHLFVKSIID